MRNLSVFRILRGLFLVLLLFGKCLLHAQTVAIQGIVSDEKNVPISYASVVISSDSLSRKGLSYAITDDGGHFIIDKLSSQPDIRWIHIRCMGYSSYRKKISLSSTQKPLKIHLSPSLKNLDEVVVIGKTPDVFAKGDTLVFNSRNFATGSDRSLGDVIRKMPGMELDKSGNVSYQGKAIGKVLVNGEDILSSSSGVTMNTLSADFAEQVELIDNYDDGDIANSHRGVKQQALNLKSKSKVKINGWGEGGGGWQNKYNTKASIISLLPKLSISTTLGANNTGESFISAADFITNTLDINSFGGEIKEVALSSGEQRLILPPDNENQRAGQLANIGITWQPTKQYRLTSSTLYNHGISAGNSFSEERYTLLENSFSNSSQFDFKNENRFFSQRIAHRWIPSSSFSLLTKTQGDLYTHKSVDKYINHFGEKLLSAREDLTNRDFSIRQDIEAKQIVGKGLLFLGGTFEFSRNRKAQKIQANQWLLPFESIKQSSNDYLHLNHSERADAYTQIYTYVGGSYPIAENTFLKAEFSYKKQKEQDEYYLNLNPPLKVGETSLLNAFKGYVSIFKNEGFFQYDGGVYFASYGLSQSPIQVTRSTIKAIEPRGTVGFHFSSRHSLTLSSSYAIAPSSAASYSRAMWISDYRGFRLPSQMTQPFARKLKADAQYHYVSLFRRLFFFAFLRYESARDEALSVTKNKGLLTENYYENGGKRDDFHTNISVTKGLGSSSIDLKSTLSYANTSLYLKRNDLLDKLQVHGIIGRIALQSRYRKVPINFEVEINYDRLNQKFIQSDMSAWKEEFGGWLSLFSNIDKLHISVTGKASRIRENLTSHNFFDLDFKIRYCWKKFDLQLSGENIFHLKNNDWIRNTLTPSYQSSTLYRRIPGNILLSLRYTL